MSAQLSNIVVIWKKNHRSRKKLLIFYQFQFFVVTSHYMLNIFHF